MREGLRENAAQFTLLVVINGFVGSMVGLERALLPVLADQEFGLVARTALLSFLVVFGLSKAAANGLAGSLADRYGRRRVLLAGWLLAAPVPLALVLAPSWGWIVAANALLGLSQGLTWSATVVMKIDLAGPRQRGLAMGLNEFAGYLAVGLTALVTGALAGSWGPRLPLALGLVSVALGLGLSLFARETRSPVEAPPSDAVEGLFWTVTAREPTLSSATQAGFVNNLNDGMAWGLFPLVFLEAGMDLTQVGWLAAAYPVVWGLGQLATGPASDSLGRKPFIVGGLVVQAAGIGLVASLRGFDGLLAGSVLLGAGTAMVYPTLLAAVSDAAAPSWRGRAVGVYRLWRDGGYAAGALLSGVVADAFGLSAALWTVAGLTLASAALAAARMPQVARTWTPQTAHRLGSPR